MRYKQMAINICKILPLSKISRPHACKMTPSSWFREFAPPIEKKKYPLFRGNEYERGLRFGREWPCADQATIHYLNIIKPLCLNMKVSNIVLQSLLFPVRRVVLSQQYTLKRNLMLHT